MTVGNFILNRFFTQYMIRDLVSKQINSIYENLISMFVDDTAQNNADAIGQIYSYMQRNYRNEYIYQNTLLNKLLLGRHSLNTTTALTQVPINKSKADFVLINGKAVVYEIKSELDSFERLETQLSDYYKAFDYVCVVTSEDNLLKLEKILGDSAVGICVLTKKNTLRFVKEARENKNFLDHRMIFKVLNKAEHEEIIIDWYGMLPDVKQVFLYKECLSLFCDIPMSELYPRYLKQLKKRNSVIKERFSQVPYELKSLIYFYNAKQKDYDELNLFLNSKVRG